MHQGDQFSHTVLPRAHTFGLGNTDTFLPHIQQVPLVCILPGKVDIVDNTSLLYGSLELTCYPERLLANR